MQQRIKARRWTLVAASMVLAVLACASPEIVLFQPTPTSTATPGLALSLLTAQPPITMSPIATLPHAEPFDTPTPHATPTPNVPYLTGDMRLYPGPLHYSGDLMTVEVVIRNTRSLNSVRSAELSIDDEPINLTSEPFLDSSPLRDDVVVFRWVWDTAGQTGMHKLTVTVPLPGGRPPQKTTGFVNLLPAADRPAQEVGAKWDVRNTACCSLQFVTNTAAERDIFSLAERANKAVIAVEQKIGFPVGNKPVPLTFIDIEWGNGAYTSNEIVMSYVDRRFVPNDFDTVLRHEVTHWAMRSFGARAPLILAEGSAVYVSDGHYKIEPLGQRAAALVDLNLYVPLADLADDFRDHQHEVAYIEAGALVQYLSETYGWGKFLEVYGREDVNAGGSEWLDEVFRDEYQRSLEQVERDFKAWLREQTAGTQTDDVRLTIALYDMIRRYQDQYATYQDSMPSSRDAANVGQTSEFIRESNAPENVALETAFELAGAQLRAGDYEAVETTLDAIDAALSSGDFGREPIVDTLAIAKVLAAAGYEGQTISIDGTSATVQATRGSARMVILTFVKDAEGWKLLPVE